MSNTPDPAATFLRKARQDDRLAHVLLPLSEPMEEALGFHCQQAVEKALKAVLSIHGIRFQRTHDIAELLDLLRDAGHAAPATLDGCDTLTAYAVAYRYDVLDDLSRAGMDRTELTAWSRAAVAWASAEHAGPAGSASS